MRYHYKKLGINEKKCYDNIVTSIEKFQTKVVFVGNYSVDDMLRIVKSISYDYPGLFYVDFNEVKILKGMLQTELHINYLYNIFNIPYIKENVDNNLKLMLKKIEIRDTDSDLTKCRKIHNFLIKNIVYNYEALNNPKFYFQAYTIAGVFNESSAVCDGISKAFKFLCDYVGIESIVITGTSSLESIGNNMNHAWNIVKINGDYCHIDVTWDMCISRQCMSNRYDYFLIPDNWIERDHKYNESYRCSSVVYSYFYNTGRYIENIAQLEQYLRDSILIKGKKIIYFRYKDRCDKQMIEQLNKMVSKNITLLKVACSMYFVNNAEQNIFFVKIQKVQG